MTKLATYPLQSNNLLTGADRSARFLGDIQKSYYPEIDAQVASGDLFEAIATSLDAIAGSLTNEAPIVRRQLEDQINKLLHLQRYYKIVRKSADRRR